MVAYSVTGTEVGVRVVIKSAPADATRKARIGGKLIVDAGVTQGVLAVTPIVVGCLRGICVADEFGIEIERVVGVAEREPKVVDGEDVLKQLGATVVADASSLPGRIESVGKCVGTKIEIMIVGGLVDANASQPTKYAVDLKRWVGRKNAGGTSENVVEVGRGYDAKRYLAIDAAKVK